MSERPTIVFTDGAAKGNPGPGGWGAIVVTPDGRVTELGGGSPYTTNNKMELSGVIGALEHVAGREGPVAIYTDSTYVIQGISQWVWAWRRRGWKTATGGDVLNRDLWERLSSLVSTRGTGSIDWRWVRGHAGTPGNERVDEIAVAFSLQVPPPLYTGPLDAYALAILHLPDDTDLPKRSATGVRGGVSASKGAHSYLSVLNGIPMRHATWAECERRVKGQSGARFKKSTSAANELVILQEWGVDPNRL
jgi:ribonuclease HI